jgi:hypothetical protein
MYSSYQQQSSSGGERNYFNDTNLTDEENASDEYGNSNEVNFDRLSLHGSRGYFLKFVGFIGGCTALTLGMTVVLHIFCIITESSFAKMVNIYQLIYRCYGLLFAIIGFFCEMEWTEVIRTTTLLQFWTTRGFFYIFIALLTIQEYGDDVYLSSQNGWNLVVIVGLTLIVFGVIYTLMVEYSSFPFYLFFVVFHCRVSCV